MCFVATDKRIYTAKKNLVFYKSLDGSKKNPIAPLYAFKYKIGKRYDTNFSPTEVPPGRKRIVIDNLNQGFHSYITRERADCWGSNTFKVVISKGSRYLISRSYKEIISESIIIKRYLKPLK